MFCTQKEREYPLILGYSRSFCVQKNRLYILVSVQTPNVLVLKPVGFTFGLAKIAMMARVRRHEPIRAIFMEKLLEFSVLWYKI